ncbi:amidohydrolase family protein [Variovorax rhizosphaerae]|uniref:Amidohydrolase family protein n=1 Tax=Variovorax rhizosphaerae TaxID=1836200 RepID=A0ABU8WFG8_9BURK
MSPLQTLEAVRIPPRLQGFESHGAEVFDVSLAGGRIAAIEPSRKPSRGTLLSALVDAHAHIDKNFTVREAGAAQGNLFAAIERMATHRAGWTHDDLHARMTRGVDEAWRAGTRALRTHLDWQDAEPPLSLAAFSDLREAWRGKVELQFVALVALDVFADAKVGERIAQAVRDAGGVLGAFVYRNADIAGKLARVFDLAKTHGLALDFHVDEGLDREATGLADIADLTIAHGMQGRVVCGHACSLSVQDDASALRTLTRCAEAGIHLVSLPTTNLYLQGAWDGTPVHRGITRIREAAAQGLRACLATDNVQDSFYPYGGYDLVETFALGVQMAHLAPADDWLDTITVNPSRAMGLAWDGRIAIGCPADLVLLAATDEHELLDGKGRARTVIRAGGTIAA